MGDRGQPSSLERREVREQASRGRRVHAPGGRVLDRPTFRTMRDQTCLRLVGLTWASGSLPTEFSTSRSAACRRSAGAMILMRSRGRRPGSLPPPTWPTRETSEVACCKRRQVVGAGAAQLRDRGCPHGFIDRGALADQLDEVAVSWKAARMSRARHEFLKSATNAVAARKDRENKRFEQWLIRRSRTEHSRRR